MVLADIEDRRLQQRRNRREAELAKQESGHRPSRPGRGPDAIGAREQRLVRILETLQPSRSRRPQLIPQELTYITQILGGILLGENPAEDEAEKKKIATMYVKLLDIINHVVNARAAKPADKTMGPLDGEERVMPPAQPSSREINRMTPQDLRLWHQHRRDAMRRDATKYPTGHARGLHK